MSGSGLIYVAVIAAWAVYLLTRCLKTTPADVSSGVKEGTLLHRRGARGSEGDAKTATFSLLRPAAPAGEPEVKQRHTDQPVRLVTRPRTSKATARRRRRTLLVLLVTAVLLAGLGVVGVLPLWPVAIPVGLFLLYLYEVRVLARRSRVTRVEVPAPAPAPAGVSAPARIPGQRGTRVKPLDTDLAWDPWPTADEEPATPGPVPDLAAGWEPRPVPLPTYVTAPKAPPVVRRIDVSAGRPWIDAPAEQVAAEQERRIDDEDTQEFPVLTDELIAQIEAEIRASAADPEAAGPVAPPESEPAPLKRAAGE